jgi:uncharacterized protein with HEPN domain
MSRREDAILLLDMRDYAVEAMSFAEGRQRDELESDRMFALALMKAVETVGEAAIGISAALQSSNPQIPWSNIIGTRHRLVHGYNRVDVDILWQIVSIELPMLVLQLEAIIEADNA